MSAAQNHWTALDLELFHDGQLDPERMSTLSEDLLRDPNLRDQMALVRRVDAAARAALLQPRPAAGFFPALIGRAVPICASALLLIIVAWTAFTRHAQEPRIPGPAAAAPFHPAARIVFSLPLSAERRSDKKSAAASLPSRSSPDQRIFLGRLDRALAAGRIDEALEVLAGVTADQRRVGYRHMVDLLQSAQVAELILNQLEPKEQLAVCSDWASQPAIRPLVFGRLRRLAEEPAIAGEVQAVVAELAADPALRAWVHGYQLLHKG